MARSDRVAHEVERARARPARPVQLEAGWERRFWLALALASGLHVAFAFWSSRRAPYVPPRHETLPYVEVSLLDDTHDATTAEAPESVTSHDEPETAQNPARARASRVPQRDETLAPAEAEPAVADVGPSPPTPSEPEPPGSAGPSSAPPRSGLSLDALGVGSNPFLGMKGFGGTEPASTPPAPAPSSEAPDRTRVAEQRLRQYLVGGMLAHDRATGASRNGAVVTALKDAAMLIASPVDGQAEFVATIDATGLVTALRPTRVSSNAADWRNVAARALRALAKKRLRVPAGAAGLEVRLALSSKVQLPSGSDSVATLHRVPLLNEDGTRLSRLELPKESNKLPEATDPGALGTPMMRQPIPGGGLDGDLADLGATGRRVVHVVITDERPL